MVLSQLDASSLGPKSDQIIDFQLLFKKRTITYSMSIDKGSTLCSLVSMTMLQNDNLKKVYVNER